MVNLPVTLSESALQDLRDIQQYYLDEALPHVAERLLKEIFAKLEHLAEHPDMGRMVPEFGTKTLRELIYPPYRIVYQRDPAHVKVIRIWRGERVLCLPDEVLH
ncbi:MAG: type II toxin-antitoxin system RelE/ParE family toxin [Gammaproteobacteria bacterium]|nr:type II toxin-antitoxin system RelE/ParE family toxin [Gammaproteobacteria bacterium]